MTDPDHNPRVWGLIPAAGLGRRVGCPKQLLPYRGSTLVGTVTRTLLDANVSGVVVVTRTQLVDELQLPADSRVHISTNDDAESEMIDSIRIGLSTLAQLQPGGDDGVLVVPGDMPSLTAQSCCACVAAYVYDPERIVIATYKGKPGHPMVFPFAMRPAVDELRGGLRMLPRIYPDRTFLVDIDDPGVELDIDTAQDYEGL